jgi:hypothetical protein
MAKFFIDRPIFAWVIAIILMLAGIASVFTLPIAQYPTIAPPAVQISATYPGASAKTVENTVTQVIEQQMSGLDHLLYLSSTSDDSGTATITLTFAAGTNPDIAQVQVQNKLQLATPLLPQAVQQLGTKVTKSSSSFLLVLAFVSEDGSMNKYDLANYVASNIQDPVSRIDGVGTVTLFGSQYAMRIWLDANKLTNFGLTPVDVETALQAQNVQVAGGSLGGTPSVPGQVLQATITEATLLNTPEQFGNVLLKVNQDGSQVRIKDVARIELGGENYNFDTKYNGQPTAGFGIQLATGANALATAKAVRAKVAELSKYFPHGLVVQYPYDTTPFVRLSIEEVVKTLLEGIVLVFLVMYLFLQNLRATLIPTIAVPVVLLGTFAIMGLVGFSINTLSMFASRSHAQGNGSDYRRAGRRGARAVGGVRARGVLGRFGRRDLPAVLADDRRGDGAVRAGRVDPDAGLVRDDPQADRKGPPGDNHRLLRLVQPHVQQEPRQVSLGRAPRDQALGPLADHLYGGDLRGRPAVREVAEVVPARRRPGHDVRAGANAVGLDPGNHGARAEGRVRLLAQQRKEHCRIDLYGERLQLRRSRPERGSRVRADEGLLAASALGSESAGAGGPSLHALRQLQERAGVSGESAVDS